jgi:RHS repeat-associated protein
VANATGTTVWRWDQAEPFGNNSADENPSGLGAFDLPLRLPGQKYDAETGLHYNYFRDYDPSIGRYGESDPIGLKAGLNTYLYGGGTPLIGTDVLGLTHMPPPTDVRVCDYYLDQYSKYKCRYYLAAYAICRTADSNPVFRRDPAANPHSLQCVRVCLVNEDTAAHQRRQADCKDGCLTDKEIDDYHRVCFDRCGLNPNTYPGVGPLN